MLFWLFLYPHAISYQEQYQLFLWTGDYLLEELKVAGGLSQYIGEFIVQFYHIEWLGALLLGCVYAAMSFLVFKAMKSKGVLLALIPAVLLLWHMGDENVMLSYPVAIIIALAAFLCLKKTHFLADIAVLPILYWLIGPMAWLYAVLRVCNWKSALMLVYLLALQLLSRMMLLQQWPLESVMFGIWYYRYAVTTPVLQIIIPVVIILLAKCVSFLKSDTKVGAICSLFLVVVAGWYGHKEGYDKDKYELIKQDYLIRNERWNEVISNAERYTVYTPFWSESVNLALAMTGELSNRMFAFYQSGEDALIMPMYRDMTSNLPSMEAFYRLGMTNECLRYAFDLQESIPFGKRSGRLTMRIVESCIVSGRYDVARKHLNLLKHSLFYRDWAKDAEPYIGDEVMINSHPVWGKMRQKEFTNDFLYYYPEIAKVFYHLFVSNTNNKMAMEYMLGQVLLEGDDYVFKQLVGAVKQYNHYSTMPYTYQDAIQCMQGQPSPASRYAEYAKRMMAMGDNEKKEEESAH